MCLGSMLCFSPGSSRQPRSGHAPQPTTPSGVPTHPGKQLSAVFAGRPRGRLNTDHNSDADRVGPNSGQPGNTTPRGPSPPRTRNLFRFLVRTRTTRCQTSEGTRWGPVALCVEPLDRQRDEQTHTRKQTNRCTDAQTHRPTPTDRLDN